MTNKTEHPQAYLLRWIADGESVQWENDRNQWIDVTADTVLFFLSKENASDNFRIKPKTIRIGKYDVAEPMKEEPAEDTLYWTLNQISEPVCSYTWSCDNIDKQFLLQGMCWLNKEDAELAAIAIKELLTGTE